MGGCDETEGVLKIYNLFREKKREISHYRVNWTVFNNSVCKISLKIVYGIKCFGEIVPWV